MAKPAIADPGWRGVAREEKGGIRRWSGWWNEGWYPRLCRLRSTMQELAETTLAADKVLVF
jgi:hypothetical protein